jgi:deoxyxylulose-5-phosphate synthase
LVVGGERGAATEVAEVAVMSEVSAGLEEVRREVVEVAVMSVGAAVAMAAEVETDLAMVVAP